MLIQITRDCELIQHKAGIYRSVPDSAFDFQKGKLLVQYFNTSAIESQTHRTFNRPKQLQCHCAKQDGAALPIAQLK